MYQLGAFTYDNDAVVNRPLVQVEGNVGGNTKIIDVTLSLDTAAYASGDVLAATQAIIDAVREAGGSGVLQSLTVIDEDDQKMGLDVLLFGSNVALGPENAVPNITDANAREFIGQISFVTGDYADLGGVSIAAKQNIGLPIKAAAGSQNLYVAVISKGTGTYTASGVRLRFGILQD